MGKGNQLYRRSRFVSGRTGIDHAGGARLGMEIPPYRDIRLDIHHHDMLAVADSLNRDESARIWVARRVDQHIDPRGTCEN